MTPEQKKRADALINRLSTLAAAIQFAETEHMEKHLEDINNLNNCEMAVEELEKLVDL